MDPNGECPCCGRLWKDRTVGAVTQVIRLFKGAELRGYQCPSCAACFAPDGTLVRRPLQPSQPW